MEILIIFFLILLNGIFAMSEIAMVSSRKTRLEQLAKKGNKSAKKALDLSHNPGKFLSTVQIGITIIGLFIGIYSGEKIQGKFQTYLEQISFLKAYSEFLSVVIILIILTFFSLVLGELVPKRIGLIIPERVSRIVAFPMYSISVLAAPFIWILTKSSDLILKMLRIRVPSDSKITEEEIKAIIQEGTESGVLEQIEQEIVENVFHLSDRTIRSLMTPLRDIHWIDMNQPFSEIKSQAIESGHDFIPLYRRNISSVSGVLHVRNLLIVNSIEELVQILDPVYYVDEKISAYSALEEMRDQNKNIALVINEKKEVQGILTMNDLVDVMIGDIKRKLVETKEIIPRNDGTYLIDSLLPMADFARYFGIEISVEEINTKYVTIAGLLQQEIGGKLELGSRLYWRGLNIEVIDLDGDRVDKVLVSNVTRKLKE